jgi:cytochrome c oxidase subunit 2
MIQSAANPTGAHAAITSNLFELFLWVTGFFFLLVLLFLGWAIWRKDRGSVSDRTLRLTVTSWIGMITLGLFALTIGSYFADRRLAFVGSGQAPLRLRVTAHQWWWEVEYLDRKQSNEVATANEIRLPLGQPVQIDLVSDDVIHSLWIPNLAGKQDLIPGRSTDLQLLPRQIGHFRAQCAEFCGLQHAHMALDVIVESPAEFAAWRAKSIEPAPAPVTPEQKRGFDLVMTRQCAGCHAINGTPAYGTVGPDLSRVAHRATLAAGGMPNTRPWLERWIRDPQAIKPGNQMPKIPMKPDELHAISAYLETLQ